jgi:phosphatidylglycerophosphate synthase
VKPVPPSLLQEYRGMLKALELEEPLDVVLYRPLAFLLVKVLALGRITPNQVTLAALVPGLASAWCFWQGTPAGYLAGAILLFVTNVLDCADGMLARVRGTSSLTGYILDGLVDYIIQVTLIVSLLHGLAVQLGDPRFSWLVGVPAGLSFAWWSAMVDRLRNEWLERVHGHRRDPHHELAELQAEAAVWSRENTHHGDRLLVWFFMLYVRLWYTAPRKLQLFESDEPPLLWRQRRQHLLRMAVLMGPTMHLTLIMVAGVLGRPDWYLWTALVFGTAWGLTVLLLRAIVDRTTLFPAPGEVRSASSPAGGRSGDASASAD